MSVSYFLAPAANLGSRAVNRSLTLEGWQCKCLLLLVLLPDHFQEKETEAQKDRIISSTFLGNFVAKPMLELKPQDSQFSVLPRDMLTLISSGFKVRFPSKQAGIGWCVCAVCVRVCTCVCTRV